MNKVPSSKGNAFDWNTGASSIFAPPETLAARTQRAHRLKAQREAATRVNADRSDMFKKTKS